MPPGRFGLGRLHPVDRRRHHPTAPAGVQAHLRCGASAPPRVQEPRGPAPSRRLPPTPSASTRTALFAWSASQAPYSTSPPTSTSSPTAFGLPHLRATPSQHVLHVDERPARLSPGTDKTQVAARHGKTPRLVEWASTLKQVEEDASEEGHVDATRDPCEGIANVNTSSVVADERVGILADAMLATPTSHQSCPRMPKNLPAHADSASRCSREGTQGGAGLPKKRQAHTSPSQTSLAALCTSARRRP